MTSKGLKGSLWIIGIFLSLCFSMFTISRYFDIISLSRTIEIKILIYAICFVPLYLMVIGLFLTIKKQKKLGYYLIVFSSFYYIIRDVQIFFINREFKENNLLKLSDDALGYFTPFYEHYLIFIELFIFIVFIFLVFNRIIRLELNLKLKNYLISFSLFIILEVGLFAYPYFRSIRYNYSTLTQRSVTNYPTEIDSVILLDLEKNYKFKNYDFEVVNPVLRETVETDGTIEKLVPSIDTNTYMVNVKIILENDSIQIDSWLFEYELDGRLKMKTKIE